MLIGFSLLALTVAERRLDDFTHEMEAREDYNSGYRSMKLLGKFKRPKSHSYGPAKAKGHTKSQQYSPPPPYVPHNPQYVPPQYGPPKSHYAPVPPQYGPPKPQYGPPKPQYGPPKPQYGPPKPQYGPPKPQYGPPKSEHRPPKANYGPPVHAYGPPQQVHQPSPAYGKPQQQSYAAPPPVNAIYSPPQQVYVQPTQSYAPQPAPPPPPSAPYGQLPVAPAQSFNPSPLVTYSAADQPLPQTDYNQPPLTLHYNSHPSTDDDDDDSSESNSSHASSAPSYTAPEPDNYEPAEPKPSSDDVQEQHSVVSDQEEVLAPVLVDVDPPVAVYVSTEASVIQHEDPPKQTAYVPAYPSYSVATDNHQETDDPPKETEYISSIPNQSVQETDNNQPEAVDPPKETESEINSPVISTYPADDANFDIPTISPPISTDEALAYSPNFGDSNAFSDSTDSDFPSIFNLPTNFYKQTENGADRNKDNDFGFFQLGIFPKTSSFFEQNYNG